MKYVYNFGDGKADGKADMKNLLGGKGANLAEMNIFFCLVFFCNDPEVQPFGRVYFF